MDLNKDWKRNIILFLASQNLSLFGSMIVQYAITWYITLQTKSGVMITVSIICGFLPNLFIAPFAGVWADRYNKKMLIMLSDSLIAIASLILAILFIMGQESVYLLFAAASIRSLGTGIQIPAVGAFLPQLVPENELTKVNGINGSIQSFVALISPMLSGALLTVSTMQSLFFIDVVTAAFAVLLLLLFLHEPSYEKHKSFENQKINYYEDMSEGIKYIKNHKFVFILFVYCAIYFILVTPLAFLTPLQVTRNFGDEVWRLTSIEVTFSLGMMGGGILMATWGGFKNKIHTMCLSYLAVAICTFLVGVVTNFWIYLLLMVATGLVMPLFNTPFTVLLQQKIEQEFMGRVFSVLGMISSSLMPLSMLLFGPIADVIKIEKLLIVTGVLMVIQSFMMFFNKILIEAGKPVSND
jgi:DHA3 family macrolide efflux protein-like MFS transporter